MKPLQWTVFAAKILASPELSAFIKFLFARHRGDPIAAREEISSIPDHWADYADERAKIDAELATLKAQGK
jgi:hypothetical protein